MQAENLKFKKTLWRENDKEIRAEMDTLSKVEDLKMPSTKREQNYLKGMNLMNARIWFRYRCKITAHIKGNKSSMYKDNMQCRLCKSGETKHKNTEKCEFTKEIRKNLNLGKIGGQDCTMEKNHKGTKRLI